MRWRVWAAAVVFGFGFLLWADDLSQLEGPSWPAPGEQSFPEQHEKLIQQVKARNNQFPTQGTIGYRDDLCGPDEQGRLKSHRIYILMRYSFAPVLIDLRGDHPGSLVLTSKGIHFEQKAQRP